jgi:hypothetical protein
LIKDMKMQVTQRSTAVKKALRRRTEHLSVALGPSKTKSPPRPSPEVSGDRLIEAPIFILPVAHADSSLLQVLLNGHSRIRAPRGLTLPALEVRPSRDYAEDIMGSLGLSRPELEHLLWDRLLHHELETSGKEQIAGKVSASTWQRITSAWPDGRYVFLLRDPAAVFEQALMLSDGTDEDAVTQLVLDDLTEIEAARQALSGISVKCEELAVDPQSQTRRICDHLGVSWELEMLYDNQQPLDARAALPAPSVELPEPLRDIAKLWGYLT